MSRILPALTGTPRLLAGAALLTLLALGGTFLLDPYRNYQLALIAAYFCATAGLTILIGRSGQLSLGHAALMAAGGYGYALVVNAMTDAGASGVLRFVAGLGGAVLASGVVGLLLGLAAARLRGPYPGRCDPRPGDGSAGGDQRLLRRARRRPGAADRL